MGRCCWLFECWVAIVISSHAFQKVLQLLQSLPMLKITQDNIKALACGSGLGVPELIELVGKVQRFHHLPPGLFGLRICCSHCGSCLTSLSRSILSNLLRPSCFVSCSLDSQLMQLLPGNMLSCSVLPGLFSLHGKLSMYSMGLRGCKAFRCQACLSLGGGLRKILLLVLCAFLCSLPILQRCLLCFVMVVPALS